MTFALPLFATYAMPVTGLIAIATGLVPAAGEVTTAFVTPLMAVTFALPLFATYTVFVKRFIATAIGALAVASVTVLELLFVPLITVMLPLPLFAT